MTREEQIKGLYALKEYLTKNPIELDGHKSLPITLIDYAIETLEQEPILDKIRAEIDKIYEREGNSVDCLNVLDELKWFIDKYKGESEDV